MVMNVLNKPLTVGEKIEVNYIEGADKFVFYRLKDGNVINESKMIITWEELEMIMNKIKTMASRSRED